MPIKCGSSKAASIFARIMNKRHPLLSLAQPGAKYSSWFHDGPTYWVRSLSFEPNVGTKSDRSNHYHSVPAQSRLMARVITAILNSSTFYFYFKMVSNCRDLGRKEWSNYPVGSLSPSVVNVLADLGGMLETRLRKTAVKCSRQYPSGTVSYEEYYPAKAKSIIDKIDHVLADHYDFTDEERDYIINYDIKYRMGLDKEG